MFNIYIHNLYLLCNDYNINCYKNIGVRRFISLSVLIYYNLKPLDFLSKCDFNIDVTKKKKYKL